MRRPCLLDAFCGAGGAGMGYWQAGFDVTGVDIAPQPRYPFDFHQGDAIEFIEAHGHKFDAIHASPVCKHYSACSVLNNTTHPDQIADTRSALMSTNKIWVIENVPGAPLHNPMELCGCMFGIRTYRPRLFESSAQIMQPMHEVHKAKLAKMGRPVKPHEYMHIVGNYSNAQLAREIMGITWMSREELSQAIPPRYTEYIGRFLLAEVQRLRLHKAG